jgi:hypothetical protein
LIGNSGDVEDAVENSNESDKDKKFDGHWNWKEAHDESVELFSFGVVIGNLGTFKIVAQWRDVMNNWVPYIKQVSDLFYLDVFRITEANLVKIFNLPQSCSFMKFKMVSLRFNSGVTKPCVHELH